MELKDTNYPAWIGDDVRLRAAYRDGYLTCHNDKIAQRDIGHSRDWKETVMSPELQKVYECNQLAGLEWQAHITWAARDQEIEQARQGGRREVVEWILKTGTCPECGMGIETKVWQAQLKEWFKDNPELLKELGIEEKQ